MALKLATTYKTLPVPDGYFRITSVIPDPDNKKIRVLYQLWPSQAYRNFLGASPLDTAEVAFPYETATGDIMTFGYNKLKTLQKFAGAVDVLEAPVVEPIPVEEDISHLGLT